MLCPIPIDSLLEEPVTEGQTLTLLMQYCVSRRNGTDLAQLLQYLSGRPKFSHYAKQLTSLIVNYSANDYSWLTPELLHLIDTPEIKSSLINSLVLAADQHTRMNTISLLLQLKSIPALSSLRVETLTYIEVVASDLGFSTALYTKDIGIVGIQVLSRLGFTTPVEIWDKFLKVTPSRKEVGVWRKIYSTPPIERVIPILQLMPSEIVKIKASAPKDLHINYDWSSVLGYYWDKYKQDTNFVPVFNQTLTALLELEQSTGHPVQRRLDLAATWVNICKS
jgi:hypothetical protein